jgi:hypothetical protein
MGLRPSSHSTLTPTLSLLKKEGEGEKKNCLSPMTMEERVG